MPNSDDDNEDFGVAARPSLDRNAGYETAERRAVADDDQPRRSPSEYVPRESLAQRISEQGGE